MFHPTSLRSLLAAVAVVAVMLYTVAAFACGGGGCGCGANADAKSLVTASATLTDDGAVLVLSAQDADQAAKMLEYTKAKAAAGDSGEGVCSSHNATSPYAVEGVTVAVEQNGNDVVVTFEASDAAAIATVQERVQAKANHVNGEADKTAQAAPAEKTGCGGGCGCGHAK